VVTTRTVISFLAVLLVLFQWGFVRGGTWYVDGLVAESGDGQTWKTAFARIQEGIDAASEGDTLIVAQGTYVENIHFNGKNIILQSTEPPHSHVVRSTIIDGNEVGSVVTFSGTENETCVLSGFTIRHGKGSYGGGICGGTEDNRTHATIEDNVITTNQADCGGGLAHCDGAIRSNIILDNSAWFRYYLGGGGLLRCGGTIEHNIIARNRSEWGGGLFECHGAIQNNVVSGNSAYDGGGLYRCHGTIQNNRISLNSARYGSGGGAYQCDGTIRNNIISDNSAYFGGGLDWCKGEIVNNTISGNTGHYSGAIHGIGGPIRNCIIWGNPTTDGSQLAPWSTATYSCIQDWTGGGEGNISEDPHFASGYRLSPDSLCIDAGMNEDWMWEAVDADGNPRILQGKTSMTVDMGAYEYVSEPPPRKTWHVDGSVPRSGDGSTWETALKTVQEGIDRASHGDTVAVAEGTYVENIHFNGKSIILRSTDPSNPAVVANTIIDGDQAGPVVTFLGVEDETSVLSGLTIRNGCGEYVGGICGGTLKYRTHAAIRYNVISGNSGPGLMYCGGIIQNNTISRNTAAYGAGVYGCSGTIENNTIYGNSAESGAGLSGCSGIIRNCIVWGNIGLSQLSDCSTPTYSCIERWRGGGEGNINYFPYFVDPDNDDFHLRSWSPCVDAGDPTSPFSREPEPNGQRVNMGAYANTPEAACKSPDGDNDGLPDDWETRFLGDLARGPNDDPDDDGISNIEEYHRGFSPIVPPACWHVDGSLPFSGDGTTWETAFTTIQEGIHAASEPDTVIVAEGTYLENIHFSGENIILRSTDPSNPAVVANTIIDGNQAGPVVTFLGTEEETCVLSGFTIRNGSGEYGAGISGGTWNYPAHATIRNCTISGNSGSGVGLCDGIIESNIITSNLAKQGGGLYRCAGLIRNNIITRNAADWSGAALYGCSGTVENNTIYGNSTEWDAAVDNCHGTIRNCIVWGNTPRRIGQISNSSAPTYCCIEEWMGGGEGNIAFNPYFVNADNGDFHLRSWSPCIDAGDPSSPFSKEPEPNGGRVNMGAYGNTPEAASKSPDTDADGLPDLWEVHWFGDLEQYGAADADGDRIPNIMEYLYAWDPATPARTLVENLTTGRRYQTIQTALCEAIEGDEIVVYPGLYVENVRFGGRNVVLRSIDPLHPKVVANTILDGNQAGSVVTFSGTEDESCVLSGFSIQNGSADRGGGINGGGWDPATHVKIGTHATIEHNVITRNSGGGIYCCDGLIRSNRICGNSAGSGGGLHACSGRIENNVIFSNLARDGAGLYTCHGIIRNNIIAGNAADGQYWDDGPGGALAHCHGTIENNTIVGNSAAGGYSAAGGLYGCDAAILNCIIWGNDPPDGVQLGYSSAPTYSCIEGWTHGGEGNIAEEPRFVDPDGADNDPETFRDNNYHLRRDSPCIDAGDPSSDYSNEPEPNGGGINMGAYGNTSEATTSELVDTDGDNMRDDWETEHFGNLDRDGSGDADGDGLTDREEQRYLSDPHGYDTDGDGLLDGEEVHVHGTDPTLADTDNDGTPDDREVAQGTNPLDPWDAFTITGIFIEGNQVHFVHPAQPGYWYCFEYSYRPKAGLWAHVDFWRSRQGITSHAFVLDCSYHLFSWDKGFFRVTASPYP